MNRLAYGVSAAGVAVLMAGGMLGLGVGQPPPYYPGIPCIQGQDCRLGSGSTVGGQPIIPDGGSGGGACVSDGHGNIICGDVVLDGGGVYTNFPDTTALGAGPFLDGIAVPLQSGGAPQVFERLTPDPTQNRNAATTINAWYAAGGVWNQDDTSQPSWMTVLEGLGGQRWTVQHMPSGGHTPTVFFQVDGSGNVAANQGNIQCNASGCTISAQGVVSGNNFTGQGGQQVSFGAYHAKFGGTVVANQPFGFFRPGASATGTPKIAGCEASNETAGTGTGAVAFVDETTLSTLCNVFPSYNCASGGGTDQSSTACLNLLVPGHLYSTRVSGCTGFPGGFEMQCDLIH